MLVRSRYRKDDIFEVDSEGNLVKSSPLIEAGDIPTIRPKLSNGSRTREDGLRLEEVQQAMKDDPARRMAGGEWMTEDLLSRVADNPRLVAGLGNPRFTAALQALQKNPKEAMAKFRDHPEITNFLHEFSGIMGEHFTMLGEEEEKKKVVREVGDSDVGPMAEAVLKREADRAAKDEADVAEKGGVSQAEQEKINAVLADRELTEILMDVDMQRIMQECAVPGRMRMYMQHPEYGMKLRRLISKGLLKVEQ